MEILNQLSIEIILFLILGTFIGSFLSVVIYRIKHSLPGILLGRSECIHCKRNIGIFQLIPILSYIFQLGKCRMCKRSISFIYIVLEVVTACVLAYLFYLYPFIEITQTFEFIFSKTLFWHFMYSSTIALGLIIIFFFDILYLEVPLIIIIPLSLFILLKTVVLDPVNTITLLGGAMIFSGFFLFQYLISNKKWVGEGDIYLGILVGLLLGLELVFLGILLSYILGAIVSIFVLLKKPKQKEIPFAPFLILGTVITLKYHVIIIEKLFL